MPGHPPTLGVLGDRGGVVAPGELGGEDGLAVTWRPHSPLGAPSAAAGLPGPAVCLRGLGRPRAPAPAPFTLPQTLLPYSGWPAQPRARRPQGTLF